MYGVGWIKIINFVDVVYVIDWILNIIGKLIGNIGIIVACSIVVKYCDY